MSIHLGIVCVLWCSMPYMSAADSVDVGCHQPTATDIQAFQILSQQVPGQVCQQDLNIVTGGCPTSPYPFLLQHYRPGSASSVTGNAGITKLVPVFACRLSKYIAAFPQLYIVSGYRNPGTQAQLFNAAVAQYGSVAAARKYVAPPPCSANTGAIACGNGSNHNKGLAADLYGVTPDIQAAASQYQLHYPMSYEKWHIEPTGSVNGAQVSTGDADGSDSTPPTTLPAATSVPAATGTQQCTDSLYCSQTSSPAQCFNGSTATVVGYNSSTQQPIYQCVQQQTTQCPTNYIYSNGTCYPLSNTSQTTSASPTTATTGTGSTGSTVSTGSTGSTGTTVSTLTSTVGTSSAIQPTSYYTGTILTNNNKNAASSTASGGITTSSSNQSIALNSDSQNQISQFDPSSGQINTQSNGSYATSTQGQGAYSFDNTGPGDPNASSSNIIKSMQPPPGSQTFTSSDLSNSPNTQTGSVAPGFSVQGALAELAVLKQELVDALVGLGRWMFKL